ncbi:MAG: hypothetical protein LC803_10855 [Acidobacteria bacterium]|nr:hypothetical protein [Acidobacteriota bacterium]
MENAIEPYRQSGYVITSQTDSAITLRAPAPYFSGNLFVVSLIFMWPLAVYYLFQYNQRKGRTVCVRMTSQGQIEATGFTLDLMQREREGQRLFHKRLYWALLLMAVVIASGLILLVFTQQHNSF